MKKFYHDINGADYYFVDWTDWLEGSTISTSTWILPESINKLGEAVHGDNCLIWLSVNYGSDGDEIKITNRITTNDNIPRQWDQTLTLVLQEQ